MYGLDAPGEKIIARICLIRFQRHLVNYFILVKSRSISVSRGLMLALILDILHLPFYPDVITHTLCMQV